MAIEAYPLTWPNGLPRTPSGRRENSRFKTAYGQAIKNVQESLRAFARDSGKGLNDPVMSSSVDFMGKVKDGDPGVAIWFTWDGLQVCFAVDRYNTPAANLQAIHHIIEARRVELRHGTLHLVRQTFQGFVALPPPRGKEWWTVLGLTQMATRDQIDAAYRDKARTAHPDMGGSDDAMAALNAARDAGRMQAAN